MTEMRTYGGGAKQAQRLDEAFPFRLTGIRFDEEETHEFVATRKADTIMALRFMSISDDRVGELAQLAVLLIGKTLDNKDGVPVQWSPEALPRPDDWDDETRGKWEPKFRGPDGELHPMDQAEKFTEFSAGSSRRRWEALLVDNQFQSELEVLVEITKDLVELSTGNPTAG